MNHEVKLYQKELERNLPCTYGVKKKLLQPFQATLNEFLEDNPDPAREELNAAFGSPAEMAKTLYEQVSHDDRRRFQILQGWKRGLALLLASALLVSAVAVFFVKQRPIVVNSEIVVESVKTVAPEVEE